MFQAIWSYILKMLGKEPVGQKEKIDAPVENPATPHDDPAIPRPIVVTDKVSEINKLALATTGAFEGKGFTEVSGNFDGQGVSCGILQWCYGQGSLQQKILQPYIVKFGSIDGLGIFPKSVDATSGMSAGNAIAYAKMYMLSGTALKKEWRLAWEKFLGRLDVISIQMTAASGVLNQAHHLAEQWGYGSSPRAICFFFDIVTQNGSMKGVVKPTPSRALCNSYAGVSPNKSVWLKAIAQASDEQMVLFQAAYSRARSSNPVWFQDVFSRKGSLALGVGSVHGSPINLNAKYASLS